MRFCRARGGEQGDPLMPALYALGQHAALTQVHATLRHGKIFFATSTSSATRLALQRFSSRSSSRSSGQLASKSTLGRPRFGTALPSSRRIWTPLAPRRGQVRDQMRIEGSLCWECLSATGHLCRSGWQTKGSHIRSFSVEFQPSKTHRARGCSS